MLAPTLNLDTGVLPLAAPFHLHLHSSSARLPIGKNRVHQSMENELAHISHIQFISKSLTRCAVMDHRDTTTTLSRSPTKCLKKMAHYPLSSPSSVHTELRPASESQRNKTICQLYESRPLHGTTYTNGKIGPKRTQKKWRKQEKKKRKYKRDENEKHRTNALSHGQSIPVQPNQGESIPIDQQIHKFLAALQQETTLLSPQDDDFADKFFSQPLSSSSSSQPSDTVAAHTMRHRMALTAECTTELVLVELALRDDMESLWGDDSGKGEEIMEREAKKYEILDRYVRSVKQVLDDYDGTAVENTSSSIDAKRDDTFFLV